MSADGIILTSHADVFARMAQTSKKDAKTLWLEETKRCFGGTSGKSGHPGVAGITPPYSAGAGQSTRTAQLHGESKVEADIRSLYGTPSQAYDDLHGINPAASSAMWFLHLHDDDAAAGDIIKSNLGKSFVPFDGGALHRNTAGGSRRRRKDRTGRARSAVFYISSQEDLEAYIKEETSHVWWLASGWREPLEALGARMPAGVKKLPAPGHLRVTMNDDVFEITAGNDVKFSGQVADMQRRIDTVLNVYRVSRLNRAHTEFLASLARKSGLKLK